MGGADAAGPRGAAASGLVWTEPPLAGQAQHPDQRPGAREPEVVGQGSPHGLDEAIRPARLEAVLHQHQDAHGPGRPVDARLEPPHQPVTDATERRGQPQRRSPPDVDLPHVVEPEQRPQQVPVPHERVERGEEGHRGQAPLEDRLRRASSSRSRSSTDGGTDAP